MVRAAYSNDHLRITEAAAVAGLETAKEAEVELRAVEDHPTMKKLRGEELHDTHEQLPKFQTCGWWEARRRYDAGWGRGRIFNGIGLESGRRRGGPRCDHLQFGATIFMKQIATQWKIARKRDGSRNGTREDGGERRNSENAMADERGALCDIDEYPSYIHITAMSGTKPRAT